MTKFKVHIKDKPIIDIISPNMENGPWIAGGSIIQWLRGTNVDKHDIDVWFKDEIQFKNTRDALLGKGFGTRYETDNALSLNSSYDINNGATIIQLIRKRYFCDPTEILDCFDFTVCQFVTDGEKLIYGEHAPRDLRKKILRPNKFNSDIVKRLIKYMAYGYTPTEELKQYIFDTPDINFDFSGSLEYDNVV